MIHRAAKIPARKPADDCNSSEESTLITFFFFLNQSQLAGNKIIILFLVNVLTLCS